MKKTKLIMPLIGITATCASIAPLATLSSCSKQEYTVELSKGSKEQNLYANSKTLNLFFKQNQIENYGKTRVKMTNLKINGAEASIVDGLLKLALDSAGGMRVTLDVTTINSHYSNPSSIEFDLEFYNKENNTSYTVEGFKLNIDQTTEVPNPFEVSQQSSTIITGFTTDTAGFAMTDFANAYPQIFVQVSVPAPLGQSKIISSFDDNNENVSEEVSTSELFYKMVIPSKFTGIADGAFYDDEISNKDCSTIPYEVMSLEFEANSKMTTIGESAFRGSPFLFVSLPSSITTLGNYCFAETNNLMSLQFAPTCDHELELPAGFLKDTFLNYIKFPNYISKLGTHINGEHVGCINCTDYEWIYLDFTDLNKEQCEKLGGEHTESSGSIYLNNICTICSDFPTEETEKMIEIFIGDAERDTDFISPFAYEAGTEEGTVVLSTITKQCQKALSTILEGQYDKAVAAFEGYPLFKFEFPNFGYDKAAEQNTTVTAFSTSNDSLITKIGSPYFSSVVLPNNLETINEKMFYKAEYLWQVHIPSTVKSIKYGAFYGCECLKSIVYDGTVEEWGKISLAKADQTGDAWNYACPTITVRCTDGEVIIPEYNSLIR